MRYIPLLCVLVACGGGSSAPGTLPADQPQTVQQAFEECLATDAVDIASLVDLLQGLLVSGQDQLPQPQFDLLAGLLSGGRVPYTWDLDEDGTNELGGIVRFLDADGNTTIPFDIATLLASGIDDPLALIAQVPEGTRLELTFTLGGALLQSASEASGDGTLVFSLGGGTVTGVSGSGTFGAGPCLFDFSFDDVPVTALDGFPTADFEFDARIGADRLVGTIRFDGTETAVVSAKLNDDPEESFEIDLAAP
jgi:hypothetical protein